jgi:hypothetical protein
LPLLCLLSCGSPEDAASARFRERLQSPAPLTHAEVNQLVTETIAHVGGRPLRVRDGGSARTLDGRGRAEMLTVLSGSIPIRDAGIRRDGDRTLRGIEGPGTPAHAELDAAQTLWVDVDTFLPQRFDLTYSLPGFGDEGHDFVW